MQPYKNSCHYENILIIVIVKGSLPNRAIRYFKGNFGIVRVFYDYNPKKRAIAKIAAPKTVAIGIVTIHANPIP